MSRYDPKVQEKTVTITSGTESTVAIAPGMVLCGVEIPASLASTSLTFQGSSDGTNFQALKDDANAAVSVTVGSAAARHTVNYQDFLCAEHWKVIAGSSETNKDIVLLFRPI